MFDKEYSFKGTHAEKVNKLTAKFDDKNQLFKRNLDVYMMSCFLSLELSITYCFANLHNALIWSASIVWLYLSSISSIKSYKFFR